MGAAMTKNTKRSWRSWLRIHPAAELFPLLSETDPHALQELAEDIKQHGLRQLVSITKDEKGNPVLLDGRNRLDALELIGEEVTVDNNFIFDDHFCTCADSGFSIDPYAFVISANIRRRHLTTKQRGDLIAKLLKATPEKSNRSIAKLAKADDKTVASVRREKEATAEIPQLEKTTGADGKARNKKRRTVEDLQAGGGESVAL
jgi:hypothetical protein